jgi:hypothetical protein
LRDDKGKIIQTFVRKMGIDSNNAMELSFPKEGLGIFNMEIFTKLIVEGHSQSIM